MTARDGTPLRGRVLEVGGRRLYARTGGPAHPGGPPVVFLAGFMASGRYLEPTAAELVAHRTVVVPDLPGVGHSAHGDAPLTLPEMADLVADLINALPGPADVVANSFGCQIALELALRHPVAARRLVLTSPVTPRPLRSLFPLAAQFAAAMRRESWRYLGVLLLDLLRGWPRKGVANLRALLSYPVLDRSRRLRVPAVVVRGRRDPLVPDRFARRLAAAIPHGSYLTLDGPHALPYDMPKVIVHLVLAGEPDPVRRRPGERPGGGA